jgi:hypothetical protein
VKELAVPEHAFTPTTQWCTCAKPLPVHIAERKGAAHSVCARCERPLKLTLRAI